MGWEAQTSASQPTPLAIVSSAVAGDSLERVACSASEALSRPVAIVLPSLGAPVIWPREAIAAGLQRELVAYAVAVAEGTATGEPAGIVHAVPIRIGRELVGIVATSAGILAGHPGTPGDKEKGPRHPADELAWLEAVAAAAAVTRLMRPGQESGEGDSRRALIRALIVEPPSDVAALLDHGRRLGVDLAAGAIAVCARASNGHPLGLPDELGGEAALVADLGHGRVAGLVPLASSGPGETGAAALADQLRELGMEVALSAPRRQPALLHEALREAMLLAELSCMPEAALGGQEETYRLLIGVLLRDPEELELLRSRTISPLLVYDAEHDTELLGTLGTFLARHGSTTETAEAMQLHRHTVGYRLSRVQEVSGLSPYESDGRERLSLGLKAAQILAAEKRLLQPG